MIKTLSIFVTIVVKIINNFEEQFGMLVKGVKEELLRDPVKISQLPVIFEYTLPHRLKGIREHVQYESITKEKFSKFFWSLEKMWNILDCDLLCFLVERYGKSELQNKCKTYKKNIEDFCAKTTISDLIRYWDPRFDKEKIPSELKSCVMKLSWDPKTKTVKDLREIQHKLEDALPQELARAAFCLVYLNPGSVIVLWLVWEEFLSQVMTSLKNLLHTQPEFITDNEITHFSLDETILFTSSGDKVCFKCLALISK